MCLATLTISVIMQKEGLQLVLLLATGLLAYWFVFQFCSHSISTPSLEDPEGNK